MSAAPFGRPRGLLDAGDQILEERLAVRFVASAAWSRCL